MDFDVVVVGGGPVGCFTATGIAKNGFKVLAVEEHKSIGEPVQCSGLISPRTLTLVNAPGSLVLREFSNARIMSSMGSELLINGDRIHAYAIDRSGFDRYLANQAREAGVEILTGARATLIKRNSHGFSINIALEGREITACCRLLIGADGVNSRTARWLGLPRAGGRVNMYAGELLLNRVNLDEIQVLLGQDFAPGWFGWVIPLTGRLARVGVGSIFNNTSPRYCFKRMIDSYPSIFHGCKEIRYTGGLVPFGPMKKIYASHAMLVGDAASQVKPMSGGGLYTGLRGAQICSGVANKALSRDFLFEKYLAEYQYLWDGEFSAEFESGVRHREIYSTFSDIDLHKLLRSLDRPYWRRLIARHGDIDYPSWLGRRLFTAGPWLQKFARAAIDLYEYGEKMKSRVEA
ncbi:MAG: hypothetical protein JL50_20995 [Peptococcaceae bacterium BICA1-7]|nr:MAG: hypothetical protein JL50_20995 [Peptococcaceae bacterium BICA1-7]HBV98561.1 NAD(P)/FAD-dependent oxidoreductase [Desulfotomaculum sp.]